MDTVGITIGMMADLADIPVWTLRSYERRGLLPSPHRRPRGWRVYGKSDITVILDYFNKKKEEEIEKKVAI